MVNDIAHYIHQINLVLSVISLLLNSFHLLVLTHKTMREKSTFVILIGISISDICTMSSTIYKRLAMMDNENPECLTSNSILKIYMDSTVWTLQEHFRRCSSWLGVLLASVRYCIIKNVTERRSFSKAGFGWKLIIFCQAASGILSWIYQSRFQVVKNSSEPLPISCAEFQNIFKPGKYMLSLTPLFKYRNQVVLKIFYLINVIFTRFLPCLAFPILTIFLLRELKKVHQFEKVLTRRNSFATSNELTTKLIVFMTNAYFIAEAPLGIINLVKVFYDEDDRVVLLSVDVTIFFTVLLTINSISHPIFCFLMSSRYRNAVKTIFSGSKVPNSQRSETNRGSKMAW